MRIKIIHRCDESKENCTHKDEPFIPSDTFLKIEFVKDKAICYSDSGNQKEYPKKDILEIWC